MESQVEINNEIKNFGNIFWWLATLFSLSTFLLACSVCKKLKKKNQNSQNDEVIIENGEKKEKNGIHNPGYETPIQTQKCSDNKTVQIINEKDKLAADDNVNKQNETKTTTEADGGGESPAMSSTPHLQSSINFVTSNGEVLESEKAEPSQTTETVTHTDNEITAVQKLDEETGTRLNETDIEIVSSLMTSPELAKSQVEKEEDIEVLITSEETETGVTQSTTTKNLYIEYDQQQYDDVVVPGGWRMDVKLKDLLELGLIDVNTADQLARAVNNPDSEIKNTEAYNSLKPYLFGKDPIAGLIFTESGEKKSIFQSAKEGVLRRGTAITWLEVQAATGNILDPLNGQKFSVEEARKNGLFDKVYEAVVSRATRAVTGYQTRVTHESLPFGQAVARGLIVESQGLKLLEAQLATGGIVDHNVHIKVPVDLAIKRELINEKIAQTLAVTCDDITNEEKSRNLKRFNDPNTQQSVTYTELMNRCVRDEDTGFLLYPVVRKERSRYGHSSLMSSRAGSSDNLSSLPSSS